MTLKRGAFNRRSFLAAGAASLALVSCATLPDVDLMAAVRQLLTLSTQRALGRIVGLDDNGQFALGLDLENRAIAVIDQQLGGMAGALARQFRVMPVIGAVLRRGVATVTEQISPFLYNQIATLSLRDAGRILTSGGDSATRALQGSVDTALAARIQPLLVTVINKGVEIGELGRLSALAGLKLKGAIATLLAESLTRPLTGALFDAIAVEERAIRANPASTGDRLLLQAFGRR